MKWDIKDIQNWSWQRQPLGAVIADAGNASAYRTGNWRVKRPIRDQAGCNHCLLCFIFCPDSSILVQDGQVAGFDLNIVKAVVSAPQNAPARPSR